MMIKGVEAENFKGGRGATEKQDWKVPPLSLPLLYQYRISKSKGRHGPPAPAADAHADDDHLVRNQFCTWNIHVSDWF